MSRFLSIVTVVSASLASLVGCGGSPERDVDTGDTSALDAALVGDSSESATASAQGSGLAAPLFLGLDSRTLWNGSTATDAAGPLLAARAAIEDRYHPMGCAKLEADGIDRARLTLKDCATPGGFAHLTGVLAIVLSGEPGNVRVDLSAPTGLVAGDRSIEFAASVDIVTTDGTQTITWKTTTWRATTARGTAFSHTTDVTITLDLASMCTVTSGSTMGHAETTDAAGGVETRGLSTVIDGFAVCPGKCPTNGTLRSTGERTHRTVVLRFDGSSSVHVTGVHGRTFDLPLACGA